MKFAIDAMGGDNAPKAMVLGAVRAAEAFPEDTFILYGNEEDIQEILTSNSPNNVQVVHCSEKIETGDDPVKSVRTKKDSSMVQAVQAVKNGEADAVLSSGNTGALLTLGTLQVGRIKGMARPSLLVTLPSMTNLGKYTVLVDAGANAEAKAKYLWQNALMGSAYAQRILKIKKPRVGLLNNGTEEEKGNPVTKEAYQLLKKETNLHFIGNVEARNVTNDVCDVLVCDGFTGNAVLKSIEGTASAVLHLLKETLLQSGFLTKIGGLLIKKALKKKIKQLDYDEAGAGLLVGVKAPVLKCHGNATDRTIFYALKQARQIVSTELYPELIEVFQEIATMERQQEKNER